MPPRLRAGQVSLSKISTPAPPAAETLTIYAKDKDGVLTLYYMRDDGTEVEIVDTGAAAPAGFLTFPRGVYTEVDHGDSSPVELVAADPAYDRIALVYGIGLEAGSPNTGGTPAAEFNVGSETTDPTAGFSDLTNWQVDDQIVAMCYLPATEALVCTIEEVGTAGRIEFRVTVLTMPP